MERSKSKVRIKSPEKRARIGERIKIAATSAGLTLKELAEQVQAPPALIYQYVRGITNVPPEILQAIANATMVSIEFFDPDRDTRNAYAVPSQLASPSERNTEATRAALDMRYLQRLVDAYGAPARNLSGQIAAYHEMIALARVLGDHAQEGTLLWHLGRAQFEANDCVKAARSFTSARDLFAELGMEAERARVLVDLARIEALTGNVGTAIELDIEAARNEPGSGRWRALASLGDLYLLRRDVVAATKALCEAAGALETVDERHAEKDGITRLAALAAQIARDTGHYDAALLLREQGLKDAIALHDPEACIDALLDMSLCCHLTGRLTEGMQRADQAATLSELLADSPDQLGLISARRAEFHLSLGQFTEAKEDARVALRTAARCGEPEGVILASLALAEVCAAAGKYEDALAYSDDAIQEARRSHRARELARAQLGRADICQRFARAGGDPGNYAEAEAGARLALESAEQIGAGREAAMALLTLAQIYLAQGEDACAEEMASRAIEKLDGGAVALSSLLGEETAANLPSLLTAPPLSLPQRFEVCQLTLPETEWRAQHLLATVLAKRYGPTAAFQATRKAALAAIRILQGLPAKDADGYLECHPDIADLFELLPQNATSDDDCRSAQTLLQVARRFGL